MRYFTLNVLFIIFCFCIALVQSGCVSSLKETGPSSEAISNALHPISSGICQEGKTGRMWQVERSRVMYSQKEAKHYVANLDLGGYSDWRLPTKEELFVLYYIFYWKQNGSCTMKQNGEYWVASEEADPFPGHWETDFLCCPVHKYVTAIRAKGYARAVRP